MKPNKVKTKPILPLIGSDRNALALVAQVRKALQNMGMMEEAEKYTHEAMKGDVHHLLQTTLNYVEVI